MNVPNATTEAPSILQPCLPGFPYKKIKSAQHHTLLNWHIQLHTVWRNPLQLNHWPSDEPYNSDRRHWTAVEPSPTAKGADLILSRDPGCEEMVGLSELGNLLLISRHAATFLVQEHGIPYEEVTRRNHRAFDIPLAPALIRLMGLRRGKSITRNRAAWGWLAIAAGLWTPDRGYRLSPEDDYSYELRMQGGLVPHLRELEGGAYKAACAHNRRKTTTEAYRRFRRQAALTKQLCVLGKFAPQEALCHAWDEVSREGW